MQGQMTFLQKTSESLDTEFVKLVKQTENSKDVPSNFKDPQE